MTRLARAVATMMAVRGAFYLPKALKRAKTARHSVGILVRLDKESGSVLGSPGNSEGDDLRTAEPV